MGDGGGIKVQEQLNTLQEQLENYFGMLNEMRLLGGATRYYEKPYELELYELLEDMHLPLVAGGFMDQPWMWVQQYQVIKNTIKLFQKTNTDTTQAQGAPPS